MKTKPRTAAQHLSEVQRLADMPDYRMAEILKISPSVYAGFKRGKQRLGVSACRKAYLMGVDAGLLLDPSQADIEHIREHGLLYRKEML